MDLSAFLASPAAPRLLIWVTALYFGLALGGFLTVYLTRLADPATRGWRASFLAVSRPAVSRCPCCGAALAWRDKMPIAGFLLNRGRCRFCRVAIPLFYPLIEGASGFVLLSATALGATPLSSLGWTGVAAMLLLTLAYLHVRRLRHGRAKLLGGFVFPLGAGKSRRH